MRCRIQLEIAGTVDLYSIVISGFQVQVGAALLIGGDGVHQSAVHPANLKSDIGDTLGFIALTDLNEVRVDNHRRSTGIWGDGVAVDAGHLGADDSACDIGEDNLPQRVRPVQPIGGQLAALGVHHLAVRIGDFKLYPSQGSLFVGAGQLVDDEVSQRLVAKFQGNGLSGFDLNGLWGVVQQVACFCPDLLNYQRGSWVDILHQEAA